MNVPPSVDQFIRGRGKFRSQIGKANSPLFFSLSLSRGSPRKSYSRIHSSKTGGVLVGKAATFHRHAHQKPKKSLFEREELNWLSYFSSPGLVILYPSNSRFSIKLGLKWRLNVRFSGSPRWCSICDAGWENDPIWAAIRGSRVV